MTNFGLSQSRTQGYRIGLHGKARTGRQRLAMLVHAVVFAAAFLFVAAFVCGIGN